MPGIFWGVKFQDHIFFGFTIRSSVGPSHHVYCEYPPSPLGHTMPPSIRAVVLGGAIYGKFN